MRFRNVSGDVIDVPALALRAIEPNHEVTVTGDDAAALEKSEAFTRVDKPKSSRKVTAERVSRPSSQRTPRPSVPPHPATPPTAEAAPPRQEPQ